MHWSARSVLLLLLPLLDVVNLSHYGGAGAWLHQELSNSSTQPLRHLRER